MAKRDVAGGGGESESLVVVAFQKAQPGSGADAAGFEEFQKTAIAFIDAADGIRGTGRGVRQQSESTMAAAGGAFHLAEVAVGADAIFSELGEEFGFEVGGNGVLEALGFVVNLPPLHAEKFGQHALDEVMAEGELAGDFAAGGGEANVTVGEDADQAIFFQAA